MTNYQIQAGARVPIDRDGTVALCQLSTGAAQQVSQAGLSIIAGNDNSNLLLIEANPASTAQGNVALASLWLLFPEARDIYALWIQASNASFTAGTGSPGPVELTAGSFATSNDSTNGLDGTWGGYGTFTNVGANRYTGTFTRVKGASDVDYRSAANAMNFLYTPPAGPDYRTNVSRMSGDTFGIRAIRFDLTVPLNNFSFQAFAIQSLHLYGKHSAPDTSDTLEPWHPTLDQPLTQADIDMGDATLGSTDTATLRFRNSSATRSANGITASLAPNNDPTTPFPSLNTIYALSTDAATWGATTTLRNLAPGAKTEVLYVRRTTPLTARMNTNSICVVASVGTWT